MVTERETIHTNTFVGGPFDGTKRALTDSERDLPWIELFKRPPISKDEPITAAATITVEREIYERDEIRCDDGLTFVFWRHSKVSPSTAVRLLFEHYSVRP